ncbi:MAG TPA: hypothetical protein VN428_22670, partial [Bryobacteraceae bacterium]|nr:hypothetical protein [Bryobacteraceae bacterium]
MSLCFTATAAGPVYVVLWFDTEDYMEPSADDAALRIARDLTSLGVRGVFKVVGEKARVLEQRNRQDVIRALAQHDIGYHTDFHSVPPTPSLYLRESGWTDGAEEFFRLESKGASDVKRIFGKQLNCYGQPGSSWGPQTNPALRRMGIHVYLDEGSQVGVESQPFWYGGLLHIFNMGKFLIRPSLEKGDSLQDTLKQFDGLAAELTARGGGVISTYYHPTEFVTTEFWDGVNFSHGAGPERKDWKLPRRRTPEDSERCYRILTAYVQHALKNPNVKFVTAKELLELYGSPIPHYPDRAVIQKHMAERQTFAIANGETLSAADMLLNLLGLTHMEIDGPARRAETTLKTASIPRERFARMSREAVGFIQAYKRLPDLVWAESEKLSIGDFAATLAADDGKSPDVAVRKANLEFERYFSTDGKGSFGWVIHPQGFDGSALLDLGRLQGWT